MRGIEHERCCQYKVLIDQNAHCQALMPQCNLILIYDAV
jgi:hypothetical protein